ncbi:MAG: NAD(P)H-hydrate dehydratase [Akkermansiaceae bacterium]
MGAVTISEMLAAEVSAMAHGWSEERLLNLAGERLGAAIGRYFPHPGTVIGYLGKGHNAGDTLVALRILRDQFSWKIEVRSAYAIADLAPLTRKKWVELETAAPLNRPPVLEDLDRPLLLLDGLLGSGGKGPLREPLLSLAREMEMLRQHAGARVAAVDLPSGIDPDSGEIFSNTVIADITFMVGNAKVGLLKGSAASATGALTIVPVDALTTRGGSSLEAITPQTLDVAKGPRPFDFHKGMAGRVAVLAGSESYMGAAVLAASGALHGGAGLITLHVPRDLVGTITHRCPLEIIVRGFDDAREVLDQTFDSLVIGCGLGTPDDAKALEILDLIAKSPAPVVIDADALNLIARLGRTDLLTENHVLTPHPGEFARLAPDLAAMPREEAALGFVERFPATLLLKGCRTLVARHGHSLWCNTTGTPGMATGGQGDLLAGVIGARLAAGDSPHGAAAIGAWLCGRSAEICMNHPFISEESLTPTNVMHHLGAAFRDWKSGGR